MIEITFGWSTQCRVSDIKVNKRQGIFGNIAGNSKVNDRDGQKSAIIHYISRYSL